MKFGIKAVDRIKVTTRDIDGNVNKVVETYDPSRMDHRIQAETEGMGCFANDLILDDGLADIADMVMNRYDYVSAGTGITSPEHDDTELESEALTRAEADKSLSTTFYTDDTVNFRGTFTPTYNISLSESGIHLLSGATGDIVFARETFPPVACLADIDVDIAWEIIFMR